MTNNYVIRWKSLVNGRSGRGSKLFTKQEAQRLVEELNREFPSIQHEAVRSTSDEALPAPFPELSLT
ncbi:MAG: hypothetical protein QOJ40_901 [Verrucomicrobiota bacterium]